MNHMRERRQRRNASMAMRMNRGLGQFGSEAGSAAGAFGSVFGGLTQGAIQVIGTIQAGQLTRDKIKAEQNVALAQTVAQQAMAEQQARVAISQAQIEANKPPWMLYLGLGALGLGGLYLFTRR